MAVIPSPHPLISLIAAVPQVLKSPWGDLNAHHHRAQKLIFTWVGKRTKYKPKREGCFKSTAGNWIIWSKRKQCSVSAECTGQRAFWCGSILQKLIYTAVMKKTLIPPIPFFPLLVTLLAPRTWSHHPSGSLTGPRNRYLFYRKWNRRQQTNSYLVLLSRPPCSGCSFGTLQLKSILCLTLGKDLNLFLEICAPITKLYEMHMIQKERKSGTDLDIQFLAIVLDTIGRCLVLDISKHCWGYS